MRRRTLIGSPLLIAPPLLLAGPAVGARGVVELMTADHRPYASAGGPEPGFVLTLAAELFRMVGLQVVFRFMPWPQAEARAAATPGAAIAPLARTPAREGRFLWAVALFDDPSGFATLHAHPPDSLDEALALPRIAVLGGGPDEAFLRAQGFSNLAPMPGRAEALAALHRREVSAWFCAMPKLRADLGRLAQFGKPVVTQPAWLAMNPESGDVPVALLREAFAALKADGSLQQLLGPVLGELR